MQAFNGQQMVVLFERLTLVQPPRAFMVERVVPQSGFSSQRAQRMCRQIIVEALKTQKIIQLQNQVGRVIEQQGVKVAELHAFKAQLELALMKPDIALETLAEGLRVKAEPQELLRDIHSIVLCYMLLSKKNVKAKEVILRKPKNDPYSVNYTPDLHTLAQIENLVQYMLGGPYVFEPDTVMDDSKLGELFGPELLACLEGAEYVGAEQEQKTKKQDETLKAALTMPSHVETRVEQEPPKLPARARPTPPPKQEPAKAKKQATASEPKPEPIPKREERGPSQQLLQYMKDRNVIKRNPQSQPAQAQPVPQQNQRSQQQLDIQKAQLEQLAALGEDIEFNTTENVKAEAPQEFEPEKHEDLPNDFDEDDFDDEEEYKEELAKSIKTIKQGLCLEYENVFDVDKSQGYLK